MRQEARDYYNRKIAGFADAGDRIFKRVIPSDISSVKKIHLSGVCGTAMGSLATLLAKKGYKLSGSDIGIYPPMSNVIASLGIEFKKGFSADNIVDADLVIIGNVCGTDNAEAKAAREIGIPTLSLPEAIHQFFIKGTKSLVVAGTHGKTTTTGLLSHVFSEAGKKPGYMIGGVMQGGEESSSIGGGEYFIIEGDEYDTAYFDKSPKFLHYAPHIAIVTSLEFDHIDIYKDMEEYTQAFKFLVKEIPEEGALFLCGDHDEVRELGKDTVAEVVTYGFKAGNQITITDVLVTEKGQEFNLIVKGEFKGTFFTPLPGNHNLLNSMAVCGVALREGVSPEELKKGLVSFKGMKRRQEVIGEIKGITILDDFAHHPTAVKETISAIKDKYPGRRLITFFEPRSNTSRRKIFENEYGKAFGGAELVFISTPALRSMDDPHEFIDPDYIVSMLKEDENQAWSVKDADELLEKALPLLKEGDVVLIMSNGAFGGIHLKLLEHLS
jgi:UDP-N-acetylmuramate: L-alanyl-gamma-D-glutamyl-meso-diaminopimelate ligase